MTTLPPDPPAPDAAQPHARVDATVDGITPDIVVAGPSSRVPGAHKDGYHELPTAPVVTAMVGPAETVEAEPDEWTPPPGPAPRRTHLASIALALASIALAASIFLGWMLPLGVAAAVTAVVALRRPAESRAIAVWAFVLACLSVLYSAGWLVWGISRSLG